MLDSIDIVKNNLGFLITDYGFEFTHEEKNWDNYIFKNRFGKIVFFEWLERDDRSITVFCNEGIYEINLMFVAPKEMEMYYKKKKGIKGFFFDSRDLYWSIVADSVKKSIASDGTIWGIKVEKK